MKTIEQIFEMLSAKFGESVFEISPEQPVERFITVNPFEVDKICAFLANHPDLKFDNLMNLSGVDDANGTSTTADDGSLQITGGTLSVYYHIESVSLKHKLVLKVSVPRESPEVVSVNEVWRHADWHEREAYDLVGIVFLNHPDLRRILMPYDWEAGHPLRKDYKNPEFYQGMKVPY